MTTAAGMFSIPLTAANASATSAREQQRDQHAQAEYRHQPAGHDGSALREPAAEEQQQAYRDDNAQ